MDALERNRQATDPEIQAYEVLDGAAERLAKLRVPEITVVEVRHWNEKKRFGKYVQRHDLIGQQHGWLLGPVMWNATTDKEGAHKQDIEFPTVLLSSSNNSYGPGSDLIIVAQTDHGWEPVRRVADVRRTSAANAVKQIEHRYQGSKAD
jgi:hypothetical protein